MQKPLLIDEDPQETQEWIDALRSVMAHEGAERARFLLQRLQEQSAQIGCALPLVTTTPYCNTLSPEEEPEYPGDLGLEERLQALVRWNAMAMVVKAQMVDSSLGGHIGTFASAATLYEVGMNHFWRGPEHACGGDLLYIQGHSSPGIYSRLFLQGTLSESQLAHFRRETEGKGLSSYPHPWLMPRLWQFPTVSMGLGPLQAVYQAHVMRYLENRELLPHTDRKVWCFCGDAEMEEPESIAGLSLAARERLDNLIFVINCNLQGLDGPVRGNGKIIQELEGIFRGCGWHVLKVIWSSEWDPLLAKDHTGALLRHMMMTVDGDYQNYAAQDGAYLRTHFFEQAPELAVLVADWSDEEIGKLKRGGHDAKKVFAAYHQATHWKGQPTVILVKTVKGYGLGSAGEALNIAHNAKKLEKEALLAFRERFRLEMTEEQAEAVSFYKPENSEEIRYLKERREHLGGTLPQRKERAANLPLKVPSLEAFQTQLAGTGERATSTTMAFVRILTTLLRDKHLGPLIVPIVPDEARTFGMEGMFRQVGIYASDGQKYRPVDADQVMYYKETQKGQILQEGITEAGAFCSWLATATAYSTYQKALIPFYIFYSMFGFQRIGDLAWAAGDLRARGFLLGGTAGRTTLNGEGLQHQDGHSLLMASFVPNCIAYDPTFAYELAVIIQYGLDRMYAQEEDVYFYITLMNENYLHPPMPEGCQEGIIRGLYLFQRASRPASRHVQLLGCGTILREVLKAVELLADFEVTADVWSVPSLTEVRREALEVARWNRLHPAERPRQSYVQACLEDSKGPLILATDYVKLFGEQIAPFLKKTFVCLGTDGFGRSDTREALRQHFEVDSYAIAYAAIKALVDEGQCKPEVAKEAMKHWHLSPEKLDPMQA